MKELLRSALVFVLLLGLFSGVSLACTTFCLKNHGEVLFGRNYDWMIGDGLVFVNKRGVSKTAAVEGEKNVKSWVSKFGSVTFNQYGRENPMGGMNEAGLVIELMWLDETKYPSADDRPAVDVLEWIQFNLDTASTTTEVLTNAASVRITSPITLHYLVNDKAGNTATIEFLDGKLVANTGDKLPVAALANDTYAKSLDFSRKAQSPVSESSLDRFTRAAAKTKDFDKQTLTEKAAVDYAFDILDNVAQKNGTQWSIVYDQKRGRIYFRTRQARQLKSIDTKALDYSCASPVRILDMNSNESGEVTSLFRNYTTAENRDLIERSFSGTPFLKNSSSSERDRAATYAETFACSVNDSRPKLLSRRSNDTAALDVALKVLFQPYYIYKQLTSS